MTFTRAGAYALLTAICLAGADPAVSAGTSAVETAQPVGTIGGLPISAAELAARTSAKLEKERADYDSHAARLKQRYLRDRQATLDQALTALIDDRVLSLEAAARNSTPAALLDAAKPPVISDLQLHAFYDANKRQINQPFDAVAEQIREYLGKQATEGAQRRYLNSLWDKYHAVALLEPYRDAVAATGPRRGPQEAPVALVEFSDFQCPYCGKFFAVLSGALKKYPTQVRLIYRHFPLSELHPNAQKAAEAAACAEEQGKFWEMHDLLFADQVHLGVEALKERAKRLDLDTGRFNECLDSGQSAPAVRLDAAAGEALGLSGTPATFVNGRFVEGNVSIEELSAVIDDELRRASPAARR